MAGAAPAGGQQAGRREGSQPSPHHPNPLWRFGRSLFVPVPGIMAAYTACRKSVVSDAFAPVDNLDLREDSNTPVRAATGPIN